MFMQKFKMVILVKVFITDNCIFMQLFCFMVTALGELTWTGEV